MDQQGDPIFFGEWVKQRRKAFDLTQAELALRAGCSVFALRKIESGERRPSKQLARLLAVSLEVPPEDQDTVIRAARGELSAGRLHRSLIPGAPAYTPTSQYVSPPRCNLPVMLTHFVGRDTELTSLGRLLQDPLCRLLTLIGPGGIGKTRLAIEAASRNQADFADGVCFVPLASLSSPEFVAPAVIGALDFAFQGQVDPHIQLLNYLSGKQMLLVLDNVEHLLGSVGLLADILQHTRGIKLLVTSRERLNLQSEWVFVVQGLSVPSDNLTERVEEFTSVELFIQTARRVKADFVLQGDEKIAVSRICQLVEGMPLGIELAATWVSVLACGQIARQIEHSLDFLTTSMRDMPNRQRSLRAVFDHSWNLLTPEERAVLSRLAVFRGNFDQDAAEQIAGAGLPILLALSSKSLLRRRENGLFDLHEVVRQYALAFLVHDPCSEATHLRHCEFYLGLLRDQETTLHGTNQLEVIRHLKDELDNVRTAWRWAVSHNKFTLIGPALRSLGWLCNVGVLYQEGIEQIELVVQALRTQPESPERQIVLGKALAQQGILFFRQGRFNRALTALEESLVILRPIDDPALLTDPLIITGIIMHLIGNINRAQALLEEGLTRAQLAGDVFYMAYALYNLGYVAGLLGHYEEGYEQMLAGLAMWRQHGDLNSIALGLNYISETAIHLGRLEEAQDFLHESLALLTPLGDRWGMGTAYRFLALVTLAQGKAEEAQPFIHKSLDLFNGVITGSDVAYSLIILGEITRTLRNIAEARCVLYKALQMAMEVQVLPLALDALTVLARLYLETNEPENALSLSITVLNHPACTYETKRSACRVRTEAEAQLTAHQIHTVCDGAAGQPLEAIVAAVIAGHLPPMGRNG